MTKKRPEIKIYDCVTQEETIREMNDSEFAQYQIDQEVEAQRLAEAEAKAAQRQALLNRLGLSEEEARILLGGN